VYYLAGASVCGQHLSMNVPTITTRHLVLLTLIAWLSMLGLDFLLHAGLLAKLYLQPSPFLLPALTAVAYLPIGYLALLLLATLLVWLMRRLELAGWRAGARIGLQLGGLMSGAFLLGLFSISTASLPLLMAWFVGQTLEMALAGAVIGSGLAGMRLRRLFALVVVLLLLCVVITIILQSTGLVPSARLP
jgi:hypothetical protein